MIGPNLSEWGLKRPSLIVFLMIVAVVAGTLSFLRLGRSEDPAITIRTMVVLAPAEGDPDPSWRVRVQAGAGIVADSVPAKEYEETLNKARGMLKALACLLPPAAAPSSPSPLQP